VATTDQYEPRLLIADVRPPDPDAPQTLYLRRGDWFPRAAVLAFLSITVGVLLRNMVSRTRRKNRDEG